MNFGKKCLLVFLCLLIPYLVVEVIYSLLCRYGITNLPPDTVWLFEESGRTIQFDPIRGVHLTTNPSRFIRMNEGVVEYIGTYRGNNQGFPDRDDFSPERSTGDRIRIAVFGDSFTAAQYVEMNWPDRVEDLSRTAPCSLDLLNFSVDGAGLANWWSILIRLVQEENYKIDGIIFAVYQNDLRRKFTMYEHRDYRSHMFGRTDSWDPKDWPKTLPQACDYISPADSTYILSESSFQSVIDGSQRSISRRPWRPYFLLQIVSLARRTFEDNSHGLGDSSRRDVGKSDGDSSLSEQISLVKEIGEFARTRALPVLVVRIASRKELISGSPPSWEVCRFAKLLDAQFINGDEAFRELSRKDIRSMFFPYDGHWNQAGSDRFARFMLEIIREWICAQPSGLLDPLSRDVSGSIFGQNVSASLS